jgi:hypothetical protein
MRTRALLSALPWVACALTAAPGAWAQGEADPADRTPPDAGRVVEDEGPPEEIGAETVSDPWSPDLVLTTGRVGFPDPNPRGVNLGLHGEYQLRVLGATDLPLDPPVRERTVEAAELGQNARVEHWLRLRGRVDVEDTLSFVLEGDVPRGFLAGDQTRFVTAARDPFDDPAPFTVHLRQAYLQVQTPIAVIRAGQQTSAGASASSRTTGTPRSSSGTPAAATSSSAC